jgi:hypothetical protein
MYLLTDFMGGREELKVIDVTLTEYTEDIASVEDATEKTELCPSDENTSGCE